MLLSFVWKPSPSAALRPVAQGHSCSVSCNNPGLFPLHPKPSLNSPRLLGFPLLLLAEPWCLPISHINLQAVLRKSVHLQCSVGGHGACQGPILTDPGPHRLPCLLPTPPRLYVQLCLCPGAFQPNQGVRVTVLLTGTCLLMFSSL